MIMLSLMGSTAVAYLAVTGLATNLALAGWGVVRTLRRAARGELANAGKEALEALSAPAVLSQAASAGLVLEVLAAVQDVVLSSQTAPSREVCAGSTRTPEQHQNGRQTQHSCITCYIVAIADPLLRDEAGARPELPGTGSSLFFSPDYAQPRSGQTWGTSPSAWANGTCGRA
jgi:hypothetical protein